MLVTTIYAALLCASFASELPGAEERRNQIAVFDEKLNSAAAAEKFTVLHPK
jgi:hypothetical protein